MKSLLSQFLALLLLTPALLSSARAQGNSPAPLAPMRLVIIGDSTVCDYPTTAKQRGWGQMLPAAFKNELQITNLAASGRSTKTFIAEGRWEKALALKPEVILIQFGHNDSHAPERPEATDAGTTYKAFLRQYIDEARAAHATPILVTPMFRRIFKEGKLTDSLLPYVVAMKAVAEEKHVALIDLHTASGKYFEGLGEAASNELSPVPGDLTHFNEKGAQAMAALVMKQLLTAEPRLKPFVR